MLFGSHGYDHFWMNKLAPVEQEREIRLSLDFLTVIGALGDFVIAIGTLPLLNGKLWHNFFEEAPLRILRPGDRPNLPRWHPDVRFVIGFLPSSRSTQPQIPCRPAYDVRQHAIAQPASHIVPMNSTPGSSIEPISRNRSSDCERRRLLSLCARRSSFA